MTAQSTAARGHAVLARAQSSAARARNDGVTTFDGALAGQALHAAAQGRAAQPRLHDRRPRCLRLVTGAAVEPGVDERQADGRSAPAPPSMHDRSWPGRADDADVAGREPQLGADLVRAALGVERRYDDRASAGQAAETAGDDRGRAAAPARKTRAPARGRGAPAAPGAAARRAGGWRAPSGTFRGRTTPGPGDRAPFPRAGCRRW